MSFKGPQLELRTDLNPRNIKIRLPDTKPKTEAQASAERRTQTIALTIGGLALSVLALTCSENYSDAKAAEAGAEAREQLHAVLPANSDLPHTFIQELECIASRAAQACKNTHRSDKFEKTKCNQKSLDEWEKSGGKNKATQGLTSHAQYLVEPWGIIPEFTCEEKGDARKLSIRISEIPNQYPQQKTKPLTKTGNSVKSTTYL